MTENQKPENRRIDNEGNYNERIEGDYVQGRNNFLNNNFSLFVHPSSNESLISAKNSRIRQILLKQVDSEVEKRLESSLHNRVYIALNVEQNPEQIELPWASEIKVGHLPKIRLENTDIINVFDQPEIAGRLLILGQPGAGKTTMLLLLASSLVNRAKNNSSYPVPVLFSLSSWKKDQQNIKDWLVEQLKDKYGVRQDIGKQWINNQEIIPLIDGLDELAAERQEKCVIKINEFLEPKIWNNPVIICSRIEEYQQYTTLLQLNNSLELYPFSPQQVEQYLQNTGNFQLWNSISSDANLSQLAKTPLLLNIIVLSTEEISIQTWQQFNSSEERLSYLFDAYIRKMLKRNYRGKNKQPKPENTQRWLSWLAQRLIQENTTEFLIEKMQPDWLIHKLTKNVYNLIFWGILGSLVNGLVWGLYGFIYTTQNKLTFGLFNGLIVGLLTGIILGQFPKQFSMIRENQLVKKTVLIYPFKLFSQTNIEGLALGLISGIIYASYGVIVKLFLGLTDLFIDTFNPYTFSEIILGLTVGITYGLIGESIQTVETLKFSLKKFLNNWREWIILGLIFGLTSELIVVIIDEFNQILFKGLSQTLFQYFIINLNSSLHKILLLGITLGLIVSIIGGLISGISGIEIENKRYANQGIWLSINNCIILSLVISLLGTLIIFPLIKATQSLQINQLISNSIFSGILLGILIGITRSGTPAIKHFILRVILWFCGYIPWNYTKFLNYSTERLFLQRVGGGYRFIHDLFRQQFASLLTEQNVRLANNQLQIIQKNKLKNILLIASVLVLMGYASWSFYLQDTNISAYNSQGFTDNNKKEYDRAIADYNQALKLDPNDANAYHNRGIAYSNKKDYDRAIADYNQALKLDPSLTLAYNSRGVAYGNKKDYDRAIADYNQAIKLDPSLALAYSNRGIAYGNKKDYDRAIADYNQAIKLDPSLALAYSNRGVAYGNKKDYDRAIADYNQVLKLDPSLALAYSNRGIAYGNKKDYDRAITDYNQALKLDPNDANAYNWRGYAYLYKEDYEHAFADLNKAIKLNPSLALAYDSRCEAYRKKGYNDSAITDCNIALKLDPKHTNSYYNRGYAYKNKGSKDKAIQDFKKVLELNDNVELSLEARQHLQELGTF